MKIDIALDRYNENNKYFLNRSPYSLRRAYQEVLHFANHAKVDSVEQITEANVRSYFLEGMRQFNWQPTTFHTKLITLRVFFDWCIQQKWMTSNPAIDIPKPRKNKKIPDKLTKDQALRLLDVVYNLPYRYRFTRYRNHAMLSMCLFAGLRRAELLTIKYADADIENMTIFVRCGKGRKDRIIPMSSTLSNILRTYILERNKIKTTIPELFITRDGKNKVELNSFTWFVKKFQKESGIKFSLHKLRHTFATLMLEGGCDIYSLSKMMGHAEITTTTIYLAASVEHLRGQIVKHPLNNF